MPAPVLITPPVWDPITLAEAKAHLRIDDSDSDALVAGLIAAAVAYFDGWTGILGRALEPQTWEMRFDRFPAWIRIPLGPVVSVTSIKYDDRDGAEQTVDPGLYQLDAAPVEACVVLAPGRPGRRRPTRSMRCAFGGSQARAAPSRFGTRCCSLSGTGTSTARR